MSTDFKSADQKLKEVILKSKDVDPDLRFMALNDLNKLLVEHSLIINKVNSYSSKIVGLLLDLLKDPNSDVQNQTLKCFNPLVSSLSDDEILDILVQLNKSQITTNTITTSIHTMAVGEILRNINLKHGSTGEQIINKLLPSLIDTNGQITPSLDAIETFTDLIKNLGQTIPQHLFEKIYTALVLTIFKSENLFSKKAITSLGYLSNFIPEEDYQNLLQLIDNENGDSYEIINLKFLTYISLAKANYTLLTPYVSDLLSFSFKHLDINNDDIDDNQIKIDEVRFQALQLITTLLSIGDSVLPFVDDILNTAKKFLLYDPYTNHDDDDEDEIDDDDDYSDDEEEEDFDDNESDDNTWKLRKQSSELVSSLAKLFPQAALLKIYTTGIFEIILNSITDLSEAVSLEKIHTLSDIINATIKQHGQRSRRKRRGSDVSMSDVEDSLSLLNKFKTSIVTKFTKELSSVKQSSKFNIFLNFFQNFNTLNDGLRILLAAIRQHNFGLNLDLLKFYSAVLENNDLEYFGSELPYIVDTINSGLTSKTHISVSNSIHTSTHLLHLTYNETLTESILEIINSSKNDSEIRNTAITSLGDLKTLPLDKVSKILNIFITTLKYEPIVISTIGAITHIVENYHEGVSIEQINRIVEAYLPLISNVSYSAYALDSLAIITHYNHVENNSLGDILYKLFNENKYESQILKILSHLKSFDKEKLKSIFLKAASIDQVDEEALFEVSSKIGPELIPTLESNLENARNIKILANIVIHENLQDYIKLRETELLEHKNGAFNLRLLGFVGEVLDLSISIEQILEFFQDDETKIHAAETLGKLISKNRQLYLNVFLDKITRDENRYLLLISIKQVLKINKDLNFEIFNQIWDTVINILWSSEIVDEDLFKISAQNIGLILVNNSDTNYFYNKSTELLKSKSSSIVYTIIASIKFILAYDNIVSIDLIESLLIEAFDKISDEDLKIKQISIITLITALNNQFNLLIPYLPTHILPRVYQELKTKKQYQETLQIGPFRHKVDKALEIRKNAFEILYKLSLNYQLLKDVNFNEILSVVISDGLAFDIISISSLIIIKLLEIDEVIINTDDKKSLSDGIDKLLGNIKKKEDQQKDSKEEQETKIILINLRNTIFNQ